VSRGFGIVALFKQYLSHEAFRLRVVVAGIEF
jgi:hypothetical protein